MGSRKGGGSRLTSIVNGSANPTWNDEFDLGKVNKGDQIEIGCWHKAPWWLDEFLGKVSIKLDEFNEEGAFPRTLQLNGRGKKEVITGSITVEIGVSHADPKLKPKLLTPPPSPSRTPLSSTPPTSPLSSSVSAPIRASPLLSKSGSGTTSPSQPSSLASSASGPSSSSTPASITAIPNTSSSSSFSSASSSTQKGRRDPAETDKVSIVARLGFWLVRRPSVYDLEDAGILPGQGRKSTTIFGKPLDLLVEREKEEVGCLALKMENLATNEEHVPIFLLKALKALRDRNAVVSEGLFRIGGCAMRMQKIIEDMNKGVVIDLEKEADVNVIAGLIKSYLRQLPDPLLTFALYEDWLSSVEQDGFTDKMDEIKRLVFELPPANRAVLRLLLPFWSEVVANEDKNRMSIFALSIVISPNLLWGRRRDDIDFRAVQNINDITVMLVRHHDLIFVPESPRVAAQGLRPAATKLEASASSSVASEE